MKAKGKIDIDASGSYRRRVRFNETCPFPIGVANGPERKKPQILILKTDVIKITGWQLQC